MHKSVPLEMQVLFKGGPYGADLIWGVTVFWAYNSMKELIIKKASFSAYLTAISKGLESCDSPSPKVITI